MIHPALLRTFATPASAAGRSATDRSGREPLEAAKRLLRWMIRWAAPEYRPERHYMRGGRTLGAKSLATG